MDLDKLAKPFLKPIRPYRPGKPIEQLQRERGIEGSISKLASNENPYPPIEAIREAVMRALDSCNRYPESGSPDLTKKLAEHHDVSAEEVFVAHGTNEILDLLVRGYVNADENCVFSELSFVIYKLVCQQNGVGGVEAPCKNFTHDLEAMARAVNDKTKIALICNPNNPTATYNTADEVGGFLDAAPDHTLVVLDEAYFDFVNAKDYPRSFELRRSHENLIILRTFSKFYSLAGARIGYAVADPRIVDILHKVRQPFNVNRLAQAAAIAALDHAGDLQWLVEETIREREAMRSAILDLGCTCPPSQTNFLFVLTSEYGGDVCAELEDHGIIVRPMPGFGAPPNSFRVNTGTPDENRRFIDTLSKILSKGSSPA